MRCPLFVAAQFCMYVSCTFTYAKHIAKRENTRLTLHGRTGDVRDASLVLKEWIAITEELRLLYLGFSAPLENAPSASCLNKKARTVL